MIARYWQTYGQKSVGKVLTSTPPFFESITRPVIRLDHHTHRPLILRRLFSAKSFCFVSFAWNFTYRFWSSFQTRYIVSRVCGQSLQFADAQVSLIKRINVLEFYPIHGMLCLWMYVEGSFSERNSFAGNWAKTLPHTSYFKWMATTHQSCRSSGSSRMLFAKRV